MPDAQWPRRDRKSMMRSWDTADATQAGGAISMGDFLKGQALALVAALTALSAHLTFGGLFGHSVYLFYAPALLVCAALGGLTSGLSVTLILAFGAFTADTGAHLPPAERDARLAFFLLLGLAIAVYGDWLRRAMADLRRRLAVQAERVAILRSSLETVADATILIDDEGRILNFSPPAEAMFGWTAATAVGRSVNILMPANQGQAHDSHIERYLATGERRVIGSQRQVTGLRKDGSEFPMALRIGEARIGDRRVFTGVARDLTTMQDAERRSDELHAQLSQIWSLNSMGEMASVLAHELNQPLSAVANYLRAARTLIANLELDDDDLIEAVSRAGDQAVRAGEIIRTMRDLATRGGAEQKPESLSAMLREIDFIVGLMVRDAGARVFYDLYRGVDIVMADRIQIQQLAVNLIRNALDSVTKFPDREIKITTCPDADGNFVVSVEDSGPGLDPTIMGRVFQPLSSTKPSGMGLGLSISRAIVENHGGRIWVEPSSLGGAAFRFVLMRAGENGAINGRSDRVRRR